MKNKEKCIINLEKLLKRDVDLLNAGRIAKETEWNINQEEALEITNKLNINLNFTLEDLKRIIEYIKTLDF